MLKIKRQVMNTYAVKNQAIQSRLTASSQKNNVSAPARWIDNRPEAAQIRQLQALANDHVAQHQPPVQRKKDKKKLPTTGDTLAKLMVSSFMPTAIRNLALND